VSFTSEKLNCTEYWLSARYSSSLYDGSSSLNPYNYPLRQILLGHSFEKTLILGKIEGRGEGDDRGWDWWHHQLDRYKFEQALRVVDGQGSPACCSLWVCKELNTTEVLNWLTGSGYLGCIPVGTGGSTSYKFFLVQKVKSEKLR